MPQQQSKIIEIVDHHLVELHPAFAHPDRRFKPYMFITDRSLLRGDYAAILTPDLYFWHVSLAKFNERYWQSGQSRLIRRVMPMRLKPYSAEEIELIKYALHFQLTLGVEVWIVFTDDAEFLEHSCGSDNLAVVRRKTLVSSPRFYDSDAPVELEVKRFPHDDVEDIFVSFERLRREPHVVRLKYDYWTFTSARDTSLKSRFGDCLYALQSGRCALSEQRLDGCDWGIDHIVPLARNGNNALVNLQAAINLPNSAKGDRSHGSRYCLSPTLLAQHCLGYTFHRRLSDRTLNGVGHPLGWQSLHRLDTTDL